MTTTWDALKTVHEVRTRLASGAPRKREAYHLCHIIESLVAQVEQRDRILRDEQSYRRAYETLVPDWNKLVVFFEGSGIHVSSSAPDVWDWELWFDDVILAEGRATTVADCYIAAFSHMIQEKYLAPGH